jgi:hypothetical protein
MVPESRKVDSNGMSTIKFVQSAYRTTAHSHLSLIGINPHRSLADVPESVSEVLGALFDFEISIARGRAFETSNSRSGERMDCIQCFNLLRFFCCHGD